MALQAICWSILVCIIFALNAKKTLFLLYAILVERFVLYANITLTAALGPLVLD